MIHLLYVGHFEKANGVMKLAKRPGDSRPQPVLVRPLDRAVVHELLKERGVEGNQIPEDWGLGVEEAGFVVCDAYRHSPEALEFIRQLARKTGCDVLYDGMVAWSPDELTPASDEPGRKVI